MVTDCARCDQCFKTSEALAQHLRTSQSHNVCSTCVIDFTTRLSLIQHYLSGPAHNYCQRCDSHFDVPTKLARHLESAHYQCLMCGLSLSFTSPKNLVEHYRHSHSACLECRQVCGTAAAFDLHCREHHWYCVDCKRVFQDGESLREHLESSTHAGRNVHCPDVKCAKLFSSGSALIQHLESGSCKSKMTRHEVNRLAVQMDVENVLTNPARLLTGPGGSAPPKITASWATERSRNLATGQYECMICHKGFVNLDRLNRHLQSSTHDEKIYRCPQGWKGCGNEFNTLGALCQHVEKGSCGVRQFNNTLQKYVTALSDGMKRLAL
ncbi:hypothetical protein FOMPIDRAFT_86042 [Fomitopsis schrenkii]|uniref:C2H2-type domain-containing protein n=1 Tax=Fomitopsis schrenkii TaxID=2126942 RepID=S8FNZ6_FOMSC|nr:hypothetical protein FOMPIDRAFT_86042 [Fomitopsis schrenkii]